RPLYFTTPHATQLYPLSLHDALPISPGKDVPLRRSHDTRKKVSSAPETEGSCLFLYKAPDGGSVPESLPCCRQTGYGRPPQYPRSEEHTSELQSRFDLVCRLLLEKKK